MNKYVPIRYQSNAPYQQNTMMQTISQNWSELSNIPDEDCMHIYLEHVSEWPYFCCNFFSCTTSHIEKDQKVFIGIKSDGVVVVDQNTQSFLAFIKYKNSLSFGASKDGGFWIVALRESSPGSRKYIFHLAQVKKKKEKKKKKREKEKKKKKKEEKEKRKKEKEKKKKKEKKERKKMKKIGTQKTNLLFLV